jgi:hypothetical protein
LYTRYICQATVVIISRKVVGTWTRVWKVQNATE